MELRNSIQCQIFANLIGVALAHPPTRDNLYEVAQLNSTHVESSSSYYIFPCIVLCFRIVSCDLQGAFSNVKPQAYASTWCLLTATCASRQDKNIVHMSLHVLLGKQPVQILRLRTNSDDQILTCLILFLWILMHLANSQIRSNDVWLTILLAWFFLSVIRFLCFMDTCSHAMNLT